MISTTLELAKQLIEKASISPEDAGCQNLIAEYLGKLGFEVEFRNSGSVSNLWARLGKTAPLFVFAGHTDVVPIGSLEDWKFPPFEPTVHEDKLYGRGAADMKGGLAAMLTACQQFLETSADFRGSLGFLITSDEEGDAVDGTVRVVEYLKNQDVQIDYCLVGEPTCEARLGDTIKVGRRGSLNGKLRILGKQGHIAYPHLASNPIQLALPVLEMLYQTEWDDGRQGRLPRTVFQISNLNAGTGATNVIPGVLEILFNFRFSDVVTGTELKQKVETILQQHGVSCELEWKPESRPFYRGEGALSEGLKQVIQEKMGIDSNFSTSGGTSDGRFIVEIANQLIEFGLCNKTIHQVNESVYVQELEDLSKIYQGLLERLLRT